MNDIDKEKLIKIKRWFEGVADAFSLSMSALGKMYICVEAGYWKLFVRIFDENLNKGLSTLYNWYVIDEKLYYSIVGDLADLLKQELNDFVKDKIQKRISSAANQIRDALLYFFYELYGIERI
jgi:hypothetical protein